MILMVMMLMVIMLMAMMMMIMVLNHYNRNCTIKFPFEYTEVNIIVNNGVSKGEMS